MLRPSARSCPCRRRDGRRRQGRDQTSGSCGRSPGEAWDRPRACRSGRPRRGSVRPWRRAARRSRCRERPAGSFRSCWSLITIQCARAPRGASEVPTPCALGGPGGRLPALLGEGPGVAILDVGDELVVEFDGSSGRSAGSRSRARRCGPGSRRARGRAP